MSFGGPPSLGGSVKGGPPDRGSFPLDHFGECKDEMKLYMDCLRKNSGTSTECQGVSKAYLHCRMKKGLMEQDDWRNLGLSNVKENSPPSKSKS
ncbi:hypothetical protein BDV98DRAFT_499155 [Pterulicium gracile]|uniref:Cytochrome c oxidase assembly protein COX19 n=1 Tax=Pterulicium gracile TaxID=1884261 RepID=A0A5C3R5J8_9AGAR|nr:hypothetical protein BDV98DRAFT_499155 [Pterula gracilis]